MEPSKYPANAFPVTSLLGPHPGQVAVRHLASGRIQPLWRCPHSHPSPDAALDCARQEMGRRPR